MSKPIEEQTTAELEKTILAEQGKQPELPAVEEKSQPPAQDGVAYTAADGTTYKAATSEELFKKVTDALNNTKIALKDREHQVRTLKIEHKEEPPAPVYDHKTYLTLLDQDGVKAQEYLRSFDKDFQYVREEAERSKREAQVRDEVTKFYQNVPEYAGIETPAFNQLIRARLEEKGRTYTADALGLTYYELKNEGVIAAGAAPAAKKPMPAAPGSAGIVPAEEPDYDNMTTKELVAYMKKNRVRGSEYLQ